VAAGTHERVIARLWLLSVKANPEIKKGIAERTGAPEKRTTERTGARVRWFHECYAPRPGYAKRLLLSGRRRGSAHLISEIGCDASSCGDEALDLLFQLG
jgi:hypothetical protein